MALHTHCKDNQVADLSSRNELNASHLDMDIGLDEHGVDEGQFLTDPKDV